jgi:hypothetical protein
MPGDNIVAMADASIKRERIPRPWEREFAAKPRDGRIDSIMKPSANEI